MQASVPSQGYAARLNIIVVSTLVLLISDVHSKCWCGPQCTFTPHAVDCAFVIRIQGQNSTHIKQSTWSSRHFEGEMLRDVFDSIFDVPQAAAKAAASAVL